MGHDLNHFPHVFDQSCFEVLISSQTDHKFSWVALECEGELGPVIFLVHLSSVKGIPKSFRCNSTVFYQDGSAVAELVSL